MKLNTAVLFGVLALIMLAGSAFGQGSIEGTITDAKGTGVGGVTVTVVGANGKAVATANTDESGAYTFDEIAPGTYKVVATASSGYKPAFRDDIAVGDDETTTLDITLVGVVQAPVPKPTVKPEPPKIIAPTPRPGINVQVGQKFSVATEAKNFTEALVMGQTMENSVISNSTVIYEVVAVEPDSITLKATVSSLRIAAVSMGQEMSFDSSRKDNSGPMAEMLGPEMTRVRTVTISRSGQVIKDDEPLRIDAPGQQSLDSNKAGGVELFEPDLTLPELKSGAVIPSRGNPPTARDGSYTVGSVNGGTASVSYAGKGQASGVLEQMGVEMNSQSTWTERSDLQMDTASRVVLTRETTKDVTIVINASGMQIPAKGKVTISEKITRLN